MRSPRGLWRRRCPPYRSVAAGLDRTKSSSARGRPLLRPTGRRSPRPVGDVAGRRFALEDTQSIDAMAACSLRDRHVGERAIIIGNGPSLRETNLFLLADEVTFGVNGIFYAREEMVST